MLVDLYEQLESKRQKISRLGTYLMLFGGMLMMMAALPGRAWRMGGASAFYVTLGILTLIVGVIGLWLLVQFVTNMREIREIKAQIAYYRETNPQEEPKRKRQKGARYRIGDDGELIRDDSYHDDDYDDRLRRRIVL